MKTLTLLLFIVLGLGFAGCSTLDSRIRRNQAAFDAWPVSVREAIRAGKVDVGFTSEQVKVALGEPSRVFSRKTEEGEEEVWAYYDGKPGFSIGVGAGSGGYSGASGGVIYDRRYDSLDDATRIVIKNGHVTAVELRKRKT